MTNATTDIFADDFSSRKDLLDHLRNDSQVFRSPGIEEAFEKVDRKDFTPADYAVEAYEDYGLPLPAGHTLTQPTTLAFMLELLAVEPGQSILEIGGGSGYASALLAELVGDEGSVLAVDRENECIEMTEDNLKQYTYSQLHVRQSSVTEDLFDEGPFDRILISLEMPENPEYLLPFLNERGIMVVPVDGVLKKIVRNGETFEEEPYPGWHFPPFEA